MTSIHPAPDFTTKLVRLYWAMRCGIAFIWLWTAYASWFLYPHAASLEWLHRLGVADQAHTLFIAACMLDFSLGIMSCIWVSSPLWRFQFALVAIYSTALAFALPEFWAHPFGPLTKNIAVLACLAYLAAVEGELQRFGLTRKTSSTPFQKT